MEEHHHIKTNQRETQKKTLAFISLYLGVVALILSCCFSLGFILGIPGLIIGIIALIKKQGALAIVGTILSTISVIISLVIIVFIASTGAELIRQEVEKQGFSQLETYDENKLEADKAQEKAYLEEIKKQLDSFESKLSEINSSTNNYQSWTSSATNEREELVTIIDSIKFMEVPEWFDLVHEKILTQTDSILSGVDYVFIGLSSGNGKTQSTGKELINAGKAELLLIRLELIPSRYLEDTINVF